MASGTFLCIVTLDNSKSSYDRPFFKIIMSVHFLKINTERTEGELATRGLFKNCFCLFPLVLLFLCSYIAKNFTTKFSVSRNLFNRVYFGLFFETPITRSNFKFPWQFKLLVSNCTLAH